jgi:hypothetical protein
MNVDSLMAFPLPGREAYNTAGQRFGQERGSCFAGDHSGADSQGGEAGAATRLPGNGLVSPSETPRS